MKGTMMNFKKWKLGLLIATLFSLFAGLGTLVDPGAGWRAFVGAFSAALLTNWAAYLMKHPVEQIEGLGDTTVTRKSQIVNRKLTDGFAPAQILISLAIVVLSILFFLSLGGCANLQPGADPLVVRVEQTETVAYSTFETLLKIDDSNRDFFRTNAPEFHKFAESLRATNSVGDRRWVSYIRSLNNVKNAYKKNKELRSDVITVLATVESIVSESQKLIADTKK